MYKINRQCDLDYINAYYYTAKNSVGQIIRCDFYEILNPKNTFNFTFHITQKRKHTSVEGDIVGKDGIKSLIWAYRCLLDCISMLYQYKCFQDYKIIVYGANRRLSKIYQYWLSKIGFKILNHNTFLYVKLK